MRSEPTEENQPCVRKPKADGRADVPKAEGVMVQCAMDADDHRHAVHKRIARAEAHNSERNVATGGGLKVIWRFGKEVGILKGCFKVRTRHD